MTQMRGALYVSMNRWVQTNHPEIHRDILTGLSAEEQDLFRRPFTYNQFYEAAPYGRFLAASWPRSRPRRRPARSSASPSTWPSRI